MTTTLDRSPVYWDDFDNLEREVRAFVATCGTTGVMPTQSALRAAHRGEIARAITKHGGSPLVAQRLGLCLAYRAPGYWDEFGNVERELQDFVTEYGTPGTMPTLSDLIKAGKSSLGSGIARHGGYRAVAERLSLSLRVPRKAPKYWDDFENVEQEVRAFASDQGMPGIMPTEKSLDAASRSDLKNALSKHGGARAVAERLGLTLLSSQKPAGFWDDLGNLDREVLEYVEEHGTPGIMPKHSELRRAGRFDLAVAITKHGGLRATAERLGLGLGHTQQPTGYWKDFGNVARELLAFIEERGLPGVMPTQIDLRDADRSDLYHAIVKHGGTTSVAGQLGLLPSHSQKPPGYWDDFANVEREVRDFVGRHGSPGIMPTSLELRDAGLHSLGIAISNHGGFASVARRLDLRHDGPERITAATALWAEQTARAIRPIAEANLLSGAQIMVILRRAGLLEVRNPRMVRLGASLARGEYNEIEEALADLASNSGNSGVEAVGEEELCDPFLLGIEEWSINGFEPDQPHTLEPPLSASASPDTGGEQTVIRGLSALGELRLPLDAVLGLLTSKLLWEAFYRRLYGWYGTLDAAVNVTAGDVEAAILSAYPEHTDNEFVAEASRRFTQEVEGAINIAGSLPRHGWCGPRLRLHQADAARRMAEILAGPEGGPAFLLNADDPGMGKSAAFLAAACASDVEHVVIVAPKTVADDTWAAPHGEIARCLPNAHIIRGIESVQTARPPTTHTFTILHYEELLNEDRLRALTDRPFDCLCLDEVHLVKQRAGQDLTRRRSALVALRSNTRSAIGLTGTPLVNELAEPMSLLQVLSQNDQQFDHARLSNRRMSDVADVFEAMLPHVVRRRKRDVLLHLPGCDVRTVPIPLPEDVEDAMLQVYAWPRARASEALVKLRKLATDAKLPFLLQRAQVAQKLLILTYLTDDVSEKIADYLADFLPGQVAHINGQTPRADRDAHIATFRADEGVRVLVGTVGTIGVGLTLFDPTSQETANEIVVADLPYTWAEFEQGIARLDREGQRHLVRVDVLQTMTTATLQDGAALQTLDERVWDLIEGKRELSDVAVDGRYETDDPASKVRKALRRWLNQAREVGVEPLGVARRKETSGAQRWRSEIARLRGMRAAQADDVFADREFTQDFLEHLKTSSASALAHQWLRGKLGFLMRPHLTLVDMGCGLNLLADLPGTVIGLDRHNLPGVLRGKMETPPLGDDSADVLIYSLSLYGTPADLLAYFTQAARVLRAGGHLFIVEPASAFTPEGLARFLEGVRKFGFEPVGGVRELRGAEGMLLIAIHLTLTGEPGTADESSFERK